MQSSLPNGAKASEDPPYAPRFAVLMAIVCVCTMLLISTFTLYHNAQSRQINLQDQMLQVQVNQVQRAIEANLQKEAYFIVWLANIFQRETDITHKTWDTLTSNIKNTFPSLAGVYWMDEQQKVLWSTPTSFIPSKKTATSWPISPSNEPNNVPVIAKLASSDITKQDTSRLTIEMQYPVGIGPNRVGYIGASYDIEEMITSISREFLRPEQHLVLSHGTTPFFGQFPNKPNILSTRVQMSLLNHQWQLTVWQPSEFNRVYFSFPMLIFVAGILVTILLGISLYLLEVNVMGRKMESQSVRKLKEEITHRRDAETQLHFIANHDPQTQLPNRFAMVGYLEQSITADHEIVLLCVTLDTFREINDMYSHLIADLLLVEATKRFKKVLPSNAILARVNREQFMVACAGMSQLEAEMLANQLRMCLEDEFHIEDNEILTSYSIGIAYRYNKEICAEDMIRHADAAAHKAKTSGTRKIVAYNQAMHEQLKQKKQLKLGIRKAINNDELQLHFQPQVDLHTGQIVAIEALIRWETHDGMMISSENIIKTAEETGLMQRLGHWVVDNALKQFSYLLDERCAPKHIAINVSGHELQDGLLAEYVIRSITRYDIPPSRVQIQFTEHVFIDNFEQNQHTLNRLSALGVSLAIDVFGTGYSSLAYLKHFPVNTLKIDRGFIANLAQSKDDMIICQSVISMANLLQLKVVAHGVETTEQHELLQNMGCHFAQGHYYYQSMNANNLITLLKKQGAGRFYLTEAKNNLHAG